jgi:hypothetical protein
LETEPCKAAVTVVPTPAGLGDGPGEEASTVMVLCCPFTTCTVILAAPEPDHASVQGESLYATLACAVICQ